MTIFPVLVAVEDSHPIRSPARVAAQRGASRHALRLCAEKIGAPHQGWSKDRSGASLPNEGFHWSVSHKRHFAAAVIANKPIGIDLEEVVPRPRDLCDALALEKEWRLLGDRDWLTFFRLWTAKEAVLKANGRGLADLLHCRLVRVPDARHLILEYRQQVWPIEHYIYHRPRTTELTGKPVSIVAAVTAGDDDVIWRVVD